MIHLPGTIEIVYTRKTTAEFRAAGEECIVGSLIQILLIQHPGKCWDLEPSQLGGTIDMVLHLILAVTRCYGKIYGTANCILMQQVQLLAH